MIDKFLLRAINDVKPYEVELNVIGCSPYGVDYTLILKGKKKIKHINYNCMLHCDFDSFIDLINLYEVKYKWNDRVVPFWRLQANLREKKGY